MNPAEEKELWRRFREEGDQQARETLIMHYMRVVRYVAGRMAIHVPSSVEMDDLVGWGIMGLLDAIEKYDPSQPVKFSTYATIRIRGAIIDQIRSLDWAPRSLRNLARRISTCRNQLRHTLGREPSSQEIAAELGITEEQVEDVLAQLQTAQVLSLDDYIADEEEDSRATRKVDLVGDNATPDPLKVAQKRERQEKLVEAILKLPEQQQIVLNLYYYEELTLKEIGMVMNVTESRVCQIHSAAMKALRKVVQDTT